jgi:hypothetical protein
MSGADFGTVEFSDPRRADAARLQTYRRASESASRP